MLSKGRQKTLDAARYFYRTNHPKVASDLFPSLAKEGSFSRCARPEKTHA